MKNKKHAGTTGKGFYAALSLSVAMVGAACWYAYSEAGKMTPPSVPEQRITHEYKPAQTTAAPLPAQTTAPAIRRSTEPPKAVTADAEAEAAAALLRRAAETTVTEAVPEPAETEAPVEQPLQPVAGGILQPFSQGELVKSKTTGIWETHNGIDFAAPLGTEVCVTEDGTVTFVGNDALFGICVTVLHENGTVTRYCGLNDGVCVCAGDVIARGKVLGAVGDTNEAESALEPHLHFEVLHNDKYIDPESYLAGALTAASKETDALQAD
ncbi:MAG: M23 family metallopeptidase [Oscillospiraceae bacterium]|nr:M23 family metallopeptidase [Oscillospiraceae bacterium]